MAAIVGLRWAERDAEAISATTGDCGVETERLEGPAAAAAARAHALQSERGGAKHVEKNPRGEEEALKNARTPPKWRAAAGA